MYKEILGKLTAKQDMTQADVVDCEKWLLVFHSLFFILCLFVYSEILHPSLKFILRRQTGITKICSVVLPLIQSPVIVKFQIIIYHERNNSVAKALFQHNQSAHTTVAVLKGMYPFKAIMEIYNLFQISSFDAFVFCKQILHRSGYILR